MTLIIEIVYTRRETRGRPFEQPDGFLHGFETNVISLPSRD